MIKEMMKFFRSVWFNVLLSVLAGFFGVMQEVWLGDFDKLNVAVLGILCAIGLSISAEIIKIVVTYNIKTEPAKWHWKDVVYGFIPGIIVALICIACL